MHVDCPFCAESIPASETVCPFCSRALGTRDLEMEAHLRAIGLWHCIGGVLWILLGLLILAGLGKVFDFPAAKVGWAVGVLILLGAVSFVLGYFLWRYSDSARLASGVLTVLWMASPLAFVRDGVLDALVMAIVPAAWGAAYLWAFFSTRSGLICSPEYRELMARTPALKASPFKSAFFWVALLAVLLAIPVLGILTLCALVGHGL